MVQRTRPCPCPGSSLVLSVDDIAPNGYQIADKMARPGPSSEILLFTSPAVIDPWSFDESSGPSPPPPKASKEATLNMLPLMTTERKRAAIHIMREGVAEGSTRPAQAVVVDR